MIVGIQALAYFRYNADARVLGYLFAAFGLGALCGAIVAQRLVRDIDLLKLAALAIVAMPLPLFVLGFSVPWSAAIVIVAAVGFFTPLVNAPLMGVLTVRTPEALRPKVLTAVLAVTSMAGPLGFVVAGYLLRRVSLGSFFIGLPALLTLGGLAFAGVLLRHLATSAPSGGDVRLRRLQAAASSNETGIEIAARRRCRLIANSQEPAGSTRARPRLRITWLNRGVVGKPHRTNRNERREPAESEAITRRRQNHQRDGGRDHFARRDERCAIRRRLWWAEYDRRAGLRGDRRGRKRREGRHARPRAGPVARSTADGMARITAETPAKPWPRSSFRSSASNGRLRASPPAISRIAATEPRKIGECANVLALKFTFIPITPAISVPGSSRIDATVRTLMISFVRCSVRAISTSKDPLIASFASRAAARAASVFTAS